MSQRILVVFLTEWGAVEGPVMWVNKRARAPETLSVLISEGRETMSEKSVLDKTIPWTAVMLLLSGRLNSHDV